MAPFSEWVVAGLLLLSGLVVFTAALGLYRLPDFFSRMHAPAVASSLASWIVALASIIYFSSRAGELRLYVWLIVLILSITAPVTLFILARSALFRHRQAGDESMPPPLAGQVDDGVSRG